jgi:hypothetical protein
MRMAVMEQKMLLVHLLRKYRLVLTEKTVSFLVFAIKNPIINLGTQSCRLYFAPKGSNGPIGKLKIITPQKYLVSLYSN